VSGAPLTDPELVSSESARQAGSPLDEEVGMKPEPEHLGEQGQREYGAMEDLTSGQQPWEEPRLTFIEPKLTKHGKLEEMTAAFFGGFTP
jgi:hypothetical protein